MKRCKDCGVDLDALDDGTFNRVLRCPNCQKKNKTYKDKTKLLGRNTKSRQTELNQYSRFVETLKDIEIQALVTKWKKEYHLSSDSKRKKIATIIKILETEYSIRTGDRIMDKSDGDDNEC